MDKIRVMNIITVVALLAAVAAGNSVGEEDVASDQLHHRKRER